MDEMSRTERILYIANSDSFLKMPMAAQALYLHMCLRADEIGEVNNPEGLARMIGASLEDVAILHRKKYIIGPNDESADELGHMVIEILDPDRE